MSDTIVLHFEGLNADQVSWRPIGKNPSPLAPKGRGSLEEAAKQIRGWRQLAVVCSSEILLTSVNIPAKNRQRLIQAIPFALENDLTEEIDQLHFAHETKSSNGVSVAVISRQKLTDWLERMNQHELKMRGLFPGVLCLPITPGNWTVFLGKDLCMIRSGASSGFLADAEILPLLLTKALTEVSVVPKQLELLIAPDLAENDALRMLDELDIPYKIISSQTGLTDILSENLDEKQTINLLQGEFKQIDSTSLHWRRWLPAAVLFCCLVGLAVITTFLQDAEYQQQSTALAQQANQVFRETFPEIQRIVDPKVQMEQQLRLLKKEGVVGNTDFLSLLAHPAKVVAGAQGSSIESISYRDGQLDLKMLLKDLQSLDAIKRSIESQNLLVEIKSANASGNQITSHLRIKRGGA